MDIGIYNAKYPFRKAIAFMLPYFKHTDPNHLSLVLLPIGLVTALIYYFAPHLPFLYLVAAFFIFLRMLFGTLDGLVAVTYNKSSANGEIINRLTPEAADIMLMLAIIFAMPAHSVLGFFAMAVSWGISYMGLIGLAGGKKSLSTGPVGQTDRIAILIIFSILQFFSMKYQWSVNFMLIFLWWVIIGGIATMVLRCKTVLKD